jgi:hypothetical protein
MRQYTAPPQLKLSPGPPDETCRLATVKPGSFSFRHLLLIGVPPPPETGEGWGGGEALGRQHTPLLSPIPAFPHTGGKG